MEIAFGNAVINVDAGAFSEVRDAVHRLIGTPITTTDARPYLLVLDQPAAFAFSAEELFELAGLVEEAYEELGEEFSNGLLYAGPPLQLIVTMSEPRLKKIRRLGTDIPGLTRKKNRQEALSSWSARTDAAAP